MNRIRYDVSSVTVVVYCTCGWRDLAADRPEAQRIAVRHEANVHPDSQQVRAAARIRRTRQLQQAEREARQRQSGTDDEL